MPILLDLFLHFMLMSLLAIGGANATTGELHRYLVETRGYLSNPEFSALYAVAQAAPGPNVLFVTLFGWHIAGFGGALLATLGMCGPSSLIVLSFEALVSKHRDALWPGIIRRGLAPLSIGLMLATGWLLADAAAVLASATAAGLLLVTVAVTLRTQLSPLWLIGLGALAGGLGLLN